MTQAGNVPALRPVSWFLASAPLPATEMTQRCGVATLLDDCVTAHRVTVLSAPSGFGKTVAVGQWATTRNRRSPGAVAWATVTGQMADVTDVLSGLITALQYAAQQRGDPALRRALSEVFAAPTPQAALDATAALADADPVTVVIDDFQFARTTLDDAGFLSFLEHCPSWLRLVLLTTDAPSPAMVRLRTHGQLAVIGPADLAMTEADVAGAAQVLGCAVTPEQAHEIRTASGGWPAAVRLMLLAGSGAAPPDADADLTEYIRAAVLHRLRPELAEFVLAATVTQRLDAALASSLTGRADAALLLAECASCGLFVERFSSTNSVVYQWHSLFLRHCQEILRARDTDRWQLLNAVAAQELARLYPLQAVEHAARAGDAALCADILTESWLELLLQSRPEALDRACATVMATFGEQPELLTIRACCRDLAGDPTGAHHLLARARHRQSVQMGSPRTDFISDIADVLIATDHDVMTAAAERSHERLLDRTVVGPSGYACALFVLGWANSRLRRPQLATAQLAAAQHECAVAGLTELAERARQSLTFAAAHAGQFDRALEVLRSRPAQSDTGMQPWLSHDGGGTERFARGWVHFWRGELEPAWAAFTEVDEAPGSGYPDIGRTMLAFTAGVLADRTRLEHAESAVARIAAADSHGVPWTAYKPAGQARLAEARGDAEAALALVAELAGRGNIPMMSAIASGISRRLGDPDLARQLAHAALAPGSQPYSQVYGQLTVALLAWTAGDARAAHHALEHGLGLAAPQRVRYPFADNPDPSCLDLLLAHRTRTAHSAFLDECLDACGAAMRLAGAHGTQLLTPREREVLAYLATPMTSEEIAARLSVSLNTLKTHRRAMYRKLGVSSRREALQAADRLGPPPVGPAAPRRAGTTE